MEESITIVSVLKLSLSPGTSEIREEVTSKLKKY